LKSGNAADEELISCCQVAIASCVRQIETKWKNAGSPAGKEYELTESND
jgi:hypothetical protein